MKTALLFVAILIALPQLCMARGGFPVEHIQYLDSAQFGFRTFALEQKAVVVISDGSCLWNPVPTPNCFLFEKQLDSYGPLIKEKGWKLYGIDVSFRNLDILDALNIRTRPTIKAFRDGKEIFSIDRLDNVYVQTPWQEELIVRIMQELN